jgi:hypothetical protein
MSALPEGVLALRKSRSAMSGHRETSASRRFPQMLLANPRQALRAISTLGGQGSDRGRRYM